MSLPKLETPTYNVTLPSGLEVKYRPFLVKEHKILLTLRDAELSGIADTIIELINACTYGQIDARKLPYFDVVYLFMKIRAKSIGEMVQISIKCECGNQVNTEYNLDDLRVVSPEKTDNLILLDSDIGIKMNYPGLKTAISLIDDPEQDIIGDCIHSIIDGDSIITKDNIEPEELTEWLDSLSLDHIKLINDFFKQAPMVIQDIDCKCDQCDREIHTEITSLYNFFF